MVGTHESVDLKIVHIRTGVEYSCGFNTIKIIFHFQSLSHAGEDFLHGKKIIEQVFDSALKSFFNWPFAYDVTLSKQRPPWGKISQSLDNRLQVFERENTSNEGNDFLKSNDVSLLRVML